MRNRRRRSAFALALASLLLLLEASVASAWDAPIHVHHDYSTGGWDYDYLGTTTYNGSCYPAHMDLWRYRRQFCPWCTWYRDTDIVCETV